MMEHVARKEEINIHKIFVAKPEGKRQLDRSKRIWDNNIKMDLTETGCECIEWIQLIQDRALNVRVP
jgi:hypothetical protein